MTRDRARTDPANISLTRSSIEEPAPQRRRSKSPTQPRRRRGRAGTQWRWLLLVALHIIVDELHDVGGARSGSKYSSNTRLLQLWNVLLGDDAAADHEDVAQLLLLEQLHHAREKVGVYPAQTAQADNIRVFLEGRVYHHLRCLPQSGVDDLHPGLGENARQELRPPIVAIQTRLRHDDLDFLLGCHARSPLLSKWRQH